MSIVVAPMYATWSHLQEINMKFMRPQELGQRHAPTCAVPAVSGSASGLSPLKVKYKYSAQRQIKIIKKYYTLVAFPAPPPPRHPLHFVALKRASKSREAR